MWVWGGGGGVGVGAGLEEVARAWGQRRREHELLHRLGFGLGFEFGFGLGSGSRFGLELGFVSGRELLHSDHRGLAEVGVLARRGLQREERGGELHEAAQLETAARLVRVRVRVCG